MDILPESTVSAELAHQEIRWNFDILPSTTDFFLKRRSLKRCIRKKTMLPLQQNFSIKKSKFSTKKNSLQEKEWLPLKGMTSTKRNCSQ